MFIEKSVKVVHCIQSETVLSDSFFKSRLRGPNEGYDDSFLGKLERCGRGGEAVAAAYRVEAGAQAATASAKSCLLLFLHH